MNPSPGTRHAAETEPQQSAERLEEVFSRCQDELLGMLCYLVGDFEDARDALQETFVKCWRQRRSISEVDNLRAWVFRVALNAGRDIRSTAWRRRRRPLEKKEAALVARNPAPEADAARREQLALVRQAVTQLRREEQEVFLLRQNGQLTYDEIAQTIDIPVGTVKTRMRLALTKLREALEPRTR
jgi:RNA polymerase sigma factor (sigma-70 family)